MYFCFTKNLNIKNYFVIFTNVIRYTFYIINFNFNMFKYYLSFYFIIFCVSVCFCSQKEQINLSNIQDYSQVPDRVFLIKNKLFFDYGAENLFLTVKISKKGKNNEIKRLKLDAEKIEKKENKIKEIPIIPNDLYSKIINETSINLGIKGNAVIQYQYEDDSGSINNVSSELNLNKKDNLKKKIKLNDEESKEVLNILINTAKKYVQDDNKFIILAKNMSGIMYFYVDTDKSYILPLILPPYQKDEEDIKFLPKTADFLYSFIIKNHVVPIITSPFTSSYRLFSTFSSALLTFSPNISETFYKESIQNNEMMDIDDFNKFLDEDLGTKEYKARLKILIDGEEFFNDLFENFRLATHSIFIQTYIFKADDFATMTANLLKEYSKTIDVRVLIDYIGSIKTKEPSKDLAYQNYTLPKDITKFLKEDSNVKVRIHPDTWITNDHKKIFLIDRKKAYLGGMNIANEYRYTWHDLMVSLEGPIVSKLVKNFYKAWSFAGLGGDFAVAYRSLFTKSKRAENIETDDMIDVRILTTSSTDYEIYDAQIEAIRRAKQRIYIENPYFSEYSLIEELINAKKRGVDVKIIFPEINDLVISDKINLKIANYLIENDIEVYLYPKMTHAKVAVYDNWVCLGSANFNKLSMFKNREINIAFYDTNAVDEIINKLFIPDFNNSKRYNKKENIPLIYYLI